MLRVGRGETVRVHASVPVPGCACSSQGLGASSSEVHGEPRHPNPVHYSQAAQQKEESSLLCWRERAYHRLRIDE